MDLLPALRDLIAGSAVRTQVIDWLSNVPGLPPIVQTVHILAFATIFGSVAFVNLRLVGLAVPGQRPSEMIARLYPFVWWALPPLVLSGLVFVIARPGRYLANPVFGIKLALLVPALVMALWLYRWNRRAPAAWEQARGHLWIVRGTAVLSLGLWVGVLLAGRWIAYADYLFDLE